MITRNVLDSSPKISTTQSPCQNGLLRASGMSDTTAVKLVAISGRNRSASASLVFLFFVMMSFWTCHYPALVTPVYASNCSVFNH